MNKMFKIINLYASYVIVFAWLLSNIYMYAQNQEQFLCANAAYKKGDIDNALSTYDAIEHKGRAVWYNMGNCAYQHKDYMNALVYWTRAERNASWHEYQDIQHNKKQVLKALGKSYEYASMFSRWRINAVPWQWSWIMVQILCLLAAFLCIVMWRKCKTKRHFFLCICIYGGLCLYAYTVHQWYQIMSASHAYVKEQSLVMYNSPDVRSHARKTLSYADYVRIISQRDDWAKINHNGQTGWVHIASLHII